MKILNENVSKNIMNKLNESARENLLSDIKYVKSLLGREMNDNNYNDKTDTQLEMILDKYKNEYNNSNINKFVVGLTIYNNTTSAGAVGFLADNNEIVYKRKNAIAFNSKKEAKEALDNYIVPEGYALVNGDIYRIKF